MNDKALLFIKKHRMISPGDVVYIGLSGGADSVALLHILYNLRDTLGFSLIALHLNHNLRGAESHRDEAFVRALCKKLGIVLKVKSVQVAKIAKTLGISVEEGARKARYNFFSHASLGSKVATAHTATDNVETVIFNMARGSALKGLCGIPPTRKYKETTLIRPILGSSRGEVEEYCHKYRLDYVIDSTNKCDDFTRNKIRAKILPVLREQNKNLEQSVSQTVSSLRRDEHFLSALAAEELEKIRLCNNNDGAACSFDTKKYTSMPSAIRLRVIKNILIENKERYDYPRLLNIDKKIFLGVGGMQLSKEITCRFAKEVFCLEYVRKKIPEKQQEIKIYLPKIGDQLLIEGFLGKNIIIKAIEYPISKKSVNNYEIDLKNCLDYDRIGGIILLRCKKTGDVIKLVGRGCTKKVRKLFTEAKIPHSQREKALIISGNQGVLWVEGFGVSEDAAINSNTKRVFTISVEEG